MKVQHELDLLPLVLKSKAKNANGRARLIIRVTLNCQSKDIPLSLMISKKNWLVKTKQVSAEEPNAKSINKKISSVLSTINGIYDKLFHTHDIVTPEMIKRVYEGQTPVEQEIIKPSDPETELTLVKVFDDYIEKFATFVGKGTRSGGTLRQWRSTKNKLTEFLLFQFAKQDLSFPEIRSNFGDKMYDYFTIEIDEVLSEATAKKHIKKVKQIISIGVKEEIIPANPIAHFVCGGDTNEVIPLEFEEVLRIFHKDFGIDRLNEVRDAYIFQIFTGFAYQDLYDLNPENIVTVGADQERWLAKHREKTSVYEIVPILPFIEQIIERYKNHPKCLKRNALIPVNSNSNYNAYLKEIAVICGINRDLNTHLARHTFADIMLNLGMPLEDVSKMLGHKSIRTTQRYCRVNKGRIQKNFNEFVRPVLTLNGLMKVLSGGVQMVSEKQENKINFMYSAPSSTSAGNVNYSLKYSG